MVWCVQESVPRVFRAAHTPPRAHPHRGAGLRTSHTREEDMMDHPDDPAPFTPRPALVADLGPLRTRRRSRGHPVADPPVPVRAVPWSGSIMNGKVIWPGRGMMVWTEPLPKDWVPMMMPRWWSWSAPATISEAEAEPPLISTTRGTPWA